MQGNYYYQKSNHRVFITGSPAFQGIAVIDERITSEGADLIQTRIEVAKILIADDIEGVRRMLTQTLEDEHRIIQADNGLEAVRLAESESPDIVILDLDMPVMDGVEAARQIKQHFSHIKIVAMSGQYKSENTRLVKEICDAFLEKPFRESELRDVIKKVT